MDAQEQVEAPRSTLRESRPPTKFPNFKALICYVIEEVVVQQEQQDALVQDDVCDIVPGSEENQFQVTLREVPSLLRGSVDVCSIKQVLPHRFCV
jgi:hypothetical protein